VVPLLKAVLVRVLLVVVLVPPLVVAVLRPPPPRCLPQVLLPLLLTRLLLNLRP